MTHAYNRPRMTAATVTAGSDWRRLTAAARDASAASQTGRRATCIHCEQPLLDAPEVGGLYPHANKLWRCQADGVPYGHMGHPNMPCPPGDINPCAGYQENLSGDCTHAAIAP